MTWIINNIVPFLIMAIACSALVFIVPARKKMPAIEFVPFTLACVWACYYSMAEILNNYRLHERGQYTVLVCMTVMCYAIMIRAKSKHGEVFSLANMIRENYGYQVIGVIDDLGKNAVLKENNSIKFKVLEPHKLFFHRDFKTAVRRLEDMGEMLCVEGFMEKGGQFGRQFHADMNESIEVVQGSFKDIVTGREYKKGDRLNYPAGTVHHHKGLEYTEIISFLEIINTTPKG